MIKKTDMSYSKIYTDRRKIDIFIPGENANGKGLFFVHGGGWRNGDKQQWYYVAEYFCSMGYSCASITYRLAPRSNYPSQIEDVRLAFSYFKANAKEFHFKPDKISAVGSSAGGHLVLMLATIDGEDVLGKSDEMKILDTKPASVICYCPVSTMHSTPDFWKETDVLIAINSFMGKSEAAAYELYTEASPLFRIKGDEPPILLIHGNSDKVVPFIHSEALHKRCLEKGSISRLHMLDGVRHGFGYGIKTEAQKQSIKIAADFLDKYVK